MNEHKLISDSQAKSLILSLEPDQFTNRYIVDRTPIIFDDRVAYADWKVPLATDLGVDPLSIVVVGSSVLGFSLSPGKIFEAFTSRSDIDVAVISPLHFDLAWRWLRDLGPVEQLSEPGLKRALQRHKKSLIFDGSIATDAILHHLPFGTSWMSALASASQANAIGGREVKTRVYRDFASLREYQARNIKNIRDEFLMPEVENIASEVSNTIAPEPVETANPGTTSDTNQIPTPQIMARRKKQ